MIDYHESPVFRKITGLFSLWRCSPGINPLDLDPTMTVTAPCHSLVLTCLNLHFFMN